MSTTVVGLFDTAGEANAVKAKLLAIGIPQSDIRLTAQNSTTTTESSTVDKSFWEELKEMFTGSDDEHYAGYYAEGARRGGTLVTVDAPDALADRAADILHTNNAVDIDSRAADWSKSGWTGAKVASTDTRTATTSGSSTQMASKATSPNSATNTKAVASTSSTELKGTNTGNQNIAVPVVEEQVELGKRQVQRGGVRIIRTMSERPVSESINLREEKVNVERRPVQRDLTGKDLEEAFRDKTIDVTETAEVAVAAKTAKVVEEVLINKDIQDRTEQVHDSVRRADVQVERIPGKETTSQTTTKTVEQSGTGTSTNRTKTSQP